MPMHVIRFETERKKMKQTVLVLCIALPFATQFSRGAINRSKLDKLKERTAEMQAHIVDLENILDTKSTEIETLDGVLLPLQQEEASTKNSLRKCATELKEFNSSLEPTIPNPLETKTVSLEDVENRTAECKRKLAEQQTYTEELEEKDFYISDPRIYTFVLFLLARNSYRLYNGSEIYTNLLERPLS
ncbi:uncharacterized protein LOC143471236 [Clavelina lepadiformis]|uniref:uncharacterized protein LOC143471236 n=1 Tax=Clavelina lepadiformis TaxID=159417 RepID=UPI0040434437